MFLVHFGTIFRPLNWASIIQQQKCTSIFYFFLLHLYLPLVFWIGLISFVQSQQKTLNFKRAGQNNYWQIWTRKSKEFYCLNFFTCILHKLQYLFKSRQTFTEVAKVCNLVFSQKCRSPVYFWLWIWFDRALRISLCLAI